MFERNDFGYYLANLNGHVTQDNLEALYQAPECFDNFRISIEFGSFIFIGFISGIIPDCVHMFIFS